MSVRVSASERTQAAAARCVNRLKTAITPAPKQAEISFRFIHIAINYQVSFIHTIRRRNGLLQNPDILRFRLQICPKSSTSSRVRTTEELLRTSPLLHDKRSYARTTIRPFVVTERLTGFFRRLTESPNRLTEFTGCTTKFALYRKIIFPIVRTKSVSRCADFCWSRGQSPAPTLTAPRRHAQTVHPASHKKSHADRRPAKHGFVKIPMEFTVAL